MYKYKVLKKCFIGGTLREPGGRHDPYVSDVKLDPQPSALKLLDADEPEHEKPKRGRPPKADRVVKARGEDVVFET
jgi:hypothetical protein